ncbi:MAG: MFS transporter [Puniceicoccales bacterium]|nr:MFS transporter [Puniceicoccales bacterium]
MDKDLQKEGHSLAAWFVWMAAVVFYLYEYLARVAPSVMEQDLEIAFHTSSVVLGSALGAYYIVYSPVQLLAGVLFDRFGGKKVLIPASLFVVLGCLLVSLPSTNLGILAMGRVLMGFGSGFGFIGVMYLAAVWFNPKKLELISGLTTSIGICGALIGQAPLARLTDAVGWQASWAYIAFAGILCTLMLIFFVRETSQSGRENRNEDFSIKNFLHGLWCVCKNRQTWIIGFVACTLYTPLVVFGDLWGVQYVHLIAGITRAKASCVVGMLYIGWLIGGPLAGYVATLIGGRRRLLIVSCLATSLILGIIFLLPVKSPLALGILLFICGIKSSPEVLCFVAGLEANPPFAKGSAIATVNMIVMLLGGLFQPIVGKLMHSSNASYDVDSFRFALTSLPLLALLGFFAAFFISKKVYKERANS